MAGDVGDPVVAELDEMPGRQCTAEQVVVADDVDSGQVEVAPADGDGGHDLGDVGHRRGAGLRAGQDHSVDAEVGQGSRHRVVEPSVQPPAVQQQVSALLREGVGQTVEEVDEPGEAHVVEQHPDRPAATFAQVTGGRVGSVAQFRDGPLHGGPSVRAHLGRAAQHERHQRLRHAGPLGHGVDRGTGRSSGHGTSDGGGTIQDPDTSEMRHRLLVLSHHVLTIAGAPHTLSDGWNDPSEDTV